MQCWRLGGWEGENEGDKACLGRLVAFESGFGIGVELGAGFFVRALAGRGLELEGCEVGRPGGGLDFYCRGGHFVGKSLMLD